MTETLSLTSMVSKLPGVGPKRTVELGELGITTIRDLLYYPPFRYETVERELLIKDLVADQTVCVNARVMSKTPIKTARFRAMVKVRVQDASGALDLTWFNNQFILSSLKVGEEYFFTGKVSVFKGHPTITNPSVERQTPEYGTLVPVYHESADITSRYLRKLVRFAFENVELSDDPAMKPLYEKHGLVSLKEALGKLHELSAGSCELSAAKHRLAFDEMFFLIKEVMEHKKTYEQSEPVATFSINEQDIKEFERFFPYTLTPSQQQAIHAIAQDVGEDHPMHRLIQGEVGSGKTTVAAFALWLAARAGKQAVLVCPTNILATQHFETLERVLRTQDSEVRVGLFTSNQKDDAPILVATHAIFQKKDFNPAIVIIDEEHRFGVEQREAFFKRKQKPHFLSMTATPIPRTVALTALADRDVSFITPHKSNENIKTWVVPTAKRKASYAWIAKMLRETGQQALIVCPFIEESFVENLASVKSAKKEFESLTKIFSTMKLDLLHGKLKPKEKDVLFAKMMNGETDILVTTPVVEVGVDIPKASIILIEGAERYGLAQLHQLRGRVGRRGQDAYCLLFTTDQTSSTSSLSPLPLPFDLAKKRLLFFARTYDGNALAEYDLKHRGSGDLLGIAQHGFDALRFASWSDTKLIETCKQEVVAFL